MKPQYIRRCVWCLHYDPYSKEGLPHTFHCKESDKLVRPADRACSKYKDFVYSPVPEVQ